MLRRLIAWLKSNDFVDSWKQHQYRHLSQVVERHVGGRSLVDVGCAEGLLTTHLRARLSRHAVVIGMDIVPHPLWPKNRSAALFLAGDASQPPFRPDVAEVVVAKDLLHHADDPGTALRWLARLATRRVVIIEANAANPVMRFYTRHNGDHHYDAERLDSLLQEVVPQAALQADQAVAYPFYLPPVRSLSAVWVWPVTAVMVFFFKVLRVRAPAGALHRLAQRTGWQPPFMIRSFDVKQCHPTVL